MNKTKLLREELRKTLASVLAGAEIEAEIYYTRAPKNHPGKYLIYTLEEVTREDGRITIELEINCHDYGMDTEACENMADVITGSLDHTVTLTEDIEFHVYANRRNNVTEEDEKVIRRRLTFDLYLYERG